MYGRATDVRNEVKGKYKQTRKLTDKYNKINQSSLRNKYNEIHTRQPSIKNKYNKIRTLQRNDIERLGDVIQEDVSVRVKYRKIIGMSSVNINERITNTTLSTLYKSIIVNIRPLLYYITISTILATLTSLAYIYFASGSWLLLLNILANLGYNVVPKVFIKVLQRSGIDIISTISINTLVELCNTNKRIRDILSTRIPDRYINSVFNRFGLNVSSNNLSIGNLTRLSLTHGIAIGTGGLSSYLISRGITSGIGLVSQPSKSIRKLVSQVSKVRDTILSNTLYTRKKTDVISETKVVYRRIRIPQIQPQVPRASQSVISGVQNMLDENKRMIGATTTAIALVTLGLSTSSTNIDTVFEECLRVLGTQYSTLSTKGIDFVRESTTARAALVGILTKTIGSTKVLDIFDKFLLPTQKAYIGTDMHKFLGVLFGERIYSRSELESMSKDNLLRVASTLRLKETVSRGKIIDLILKSQTERLGSMIRVVASAILQSSKSATIATISSMTISSYLDKPRQQVVHVKGSVSESEIVEERKKYLDQLKRQRDTRVMEARMRKLGEEAAERMIHERTELSRSQREHSERILQDVLNDYKETIERIENVMDERLREAMHIPFTPLMIYLEKMAIKSSTSWIPGLGYVTSTIDLINFSLNSAETFKDVYKIVKLARQLATVGSSQIDVDDKTLLDTMLSARLPSMDTLLNAVSNNKIYLDEVVVKALKDKILYGWDTERVAYEIGKKVIFGTDEVNVSKFSESLVSLIGQSILHQVKG